MIPAARSLAALALAAALPFAHAAGSAAYPGTVTTPTPHAFDVLVERVLAAVKATRMGVVARASATAGAKSIGVTLPGNQVIMIYHPEYAVRMLAASVPAGIEAPIRLYLTENEDGTATLTYRTPSSLFGPYGSAELDAMAAELDRVFARIVAEAAGG